VFRPERPGLAARAPEQSGAQMNGCHRRPVRKDTA